jgi:hypothetical protein
MVQVNDRNAHTPLSTAITQQPIDWAFSGHLFKMPLAAVIPRVLGVPLWAQVHGQLCKAPFARGSRSSLWMPGVPRDLISSHRSCCPKRCEQSFLP